MFLPSTFPHAEKNIYTNGGGFVERAAKHKDTMMTEADSRN